MTTLEFNRTNETDEQFASRVGPPLDEFFAGLGEPSGGDRVVLKDEIDGDRRRMTCIFEWPVIQT